MEKHSVRAMTRGAEANCSYCSGIFTINSTGHRYCSTDCAIRARYLHTFGEQPDPAIGLKYVDKAVQKLYNARSRGLDYDLTATFIQDTLEKPCHYCAGMAVVLERYDNDVGYLMTNVVPSCVPCNNLKNVLHGDNFIRYRRFMREGVIPCVIVGDGTIVDISTNTTYVKKAAGIE